MRRKFIAGNWKMNGLRDGLNEIFAIAGDHQDDVDVLICPPFTLLHEAITAAQGTGLMIGGQNCYSEEKGAYTGEVSAQMLADIGASHVIIGHSERREYFGETSDIVARKAELAWASHLVSIICVGETLAEREQGEAVRVVTNQIKNSMPVGANAENTIIAYEPVWAIGTGKVASLDDISQMHAHIRSILPEADKMRILYGGSVKASNAAEILAIEDVDGALVGGASLKANDFKPIIDAASEVKAPSEV